MNFKIETWSGYEIRFVHHQDEWWAVAKDVAIALDLKDATEVNNLVDDDERLLLTKSLNPTVSGLEIPNRGLLAISETGIYEAIIGSRKPEAKDFKKWVKSLIKTLRKSTGLEGFQVFAMLDKEHQKEAMANLSRGLEKPVRVDFIKANTIANKAISTKHGHAKMIKKANMTPEMLAERQPILDDTVELMQANEKFKLNLSASEMIYEKHQAV